MKTFVLLALCLAFLAPAARAGITVTDGVSQVAVFDSSMTYGDITVGTTTAVRVDDVTTSSLSLVHTAMTGRTEISGQMLTPGTTIDCAPDVNVSTLTTGATATAHGRQWVAGSAGGTTFNLALSNYLSWYCIAEGTAPCFLHIEQGRGGK